jgi:pimeloyl-ACP methyl ester carboxylesterase
MVDGLVVVAGGVSGFEAPPTEDEMKLWNQGEELWAEAEKSGDWSKVADLDVKVWADGPAAPEGRADGSVRDRVREWCLYNYKNHTVQGQPVVLNPPAYGRLQEIKAPTLVMVGDQDTSSTQASMKMLAESVPGAQFELYHGVAHMVNMEKPDEFNQRVLDFLQSIEQ